MPDFQALILHFVVFNVLHTIWELGCLRFLFYFFGREGELIQYANPPWIHNEEYLIYVFLIHIKFYQLLWKRNPTFPTFFFQLHFFINKVNNGITKLLIQLK